MRALHALSPRTVLVFGALSGAFAPASAAAEGAESADVAGMEPDVARLADGNAQRSNWQPPGMTSRYGRAEVLVSAPIETIKKFVVDYGHYKELTSGEFHTSRIIGRDGHSTDVYFQVQLMEGLLTMWEVFRFQDLRPLAPGWVIVEGWYLKGNIKAGNAAWTLHAIDEGHTFVRFDIFILPNIPLPESLIDDGNRNAAAEAVESIRDHAQSKPGPIPYAPDRSQAHAP